ALCTSMTTRPDRNAMGPGGAMRGQRALTSGSVRAVTTPAAPSSARKTRPPPPPSTRETAVQGCASPRAPGTPATARSSPAYAVDSRQWARAEFPSGRDAIVTPPGVHVAAGARVPAGRGAVGVRGRPPRRPVRLRVARRLRELVPLLRQGELGVRRERRDVPAACQHRRPALAASERLVSWPAEHRPDDHRGTTLPAWSPSSPPSRAVAHRPGAAVRSVGERPRLLPPPRTRTDAGWAALVDSPHGLPAARARPADRPERAGARRCGSTAARRRRAAPPGAGRIDTGRSRWRPGRRARTCLTRGRRGGRAADPRHPGGR
ncbi:MAG: hypothetical protein JWR62_3429, partial [Modestobacter sp.]|nr:hypothetical protein [Modestobacter sp.]